MNKYHLLTFSLILSSLNAGCGQINSPNLNKVPSSSYSFSSSSSQHDPNLLTDPDNYDCTGRSQIIPQIGFNLDYSNYFSVCKNHNTANNYSFLIKGRTSGAKSVCMFPAQGAVSSEGSWIADPTTHTPLYRCTSMTTDGAFFSFPEIQNTNGFNAAYIVEIQNVTAMGTCLQNQLGNCPAYSYGQFN